jgi:uncharacterized membrane protein YedE/YeeE
MESDPKVSTPWRICSSVLSVLLFIAFIILIALLDRSKWQRIFLSLICGFFGYVHQWTPISFTHTVKMILSCDFVDLIHFFVMLIFTTLIFAIVQELHSSYNTLPLFGISQSFTLKQDPIGVSSVLGAFIFGIGMQLSSGCAIGTIVGLGEGFLKAWMACLFSIIGATVGIVNPIYESFSKLPATSESVVIPWYATIVILVAIVIVLVILEICKCCRKSNESQQSERTLHDLAVFMRQGDDPDREDRLRLWRNYAIDIAVAAVLGIFFVCEGRPMAIVPALADIGSWVLRPCGIDTRFWKYWEGREMPDLLNSGDFVTVLFIGLGAFLASAFAGNFGLYQEFDLVEMVKAAVGGFAMGFGGMIAGGGNLLAVVGGIASSSVGGFLWFTAAVGGGLVVAGIHAYIQKHKRKNDDYAEIE